MWEPKQALLHPSCACAAASSAAASSSHPPLARDDRWPAIGLYALFVLRMVNGSNCARVLAVWWVLLRVLLAACGQAVREVQSMPAATPCCSNLDRAGG